MAELDSRTGNDLLVHVEQGGSPNPILIVDDSEPDQFVMAEAFKEAGVNCSLVQVETGADALDFLFRRGKHTNAPRPSLIVLDLNLPGKNGREILEEIKSDPALKHVPVLVFSNSDSPHDVCRCYELKANLYLNKPSNFREFVSFAQGVDRFWIRLGRYCSH